MALIVQKYGGTSVADLEKIQTIAQRVARTREDGNDIVVVLSAMAGETDRLIQLATQAAGGDPDWREYDVIVSSGEQVTVSLMAIMLNRMGHAAISLLGDQVRILTDTVHRSAKIYDVETERIADELKRERIVVVAGFQGVDGTGNITTLGRGGSDTTAVAIAAALKADFCEIFTDVDGVYTTDPNVYNKARKLKKISYDEMLSLAGAGAKVLHHRSVELAKTFGVPVYVRSSFHEDSGTLVTKEDEEMERGLITGVAYDRDQAKVTVVHVPDRPGIAAQLFTPLSEHSIIVDMIIQNASSEGYTDLTFTVSRKNIEEARTLLDETAREMGASRVEYDENISKISIVGVGMQSQSGVASKMFTALAQDGINILMISTSEIKISCVVQAKYTELAVRVLHDAFGLEQEP